MKLTWPESLAHPAADDQPLLGPVLVRALERIHRWALRRAVLAELRTLDDRTLADLGICRGDFRAIASGTYAGANARRERVEAMPPVHQQIWRYY